MIDYFAYSLHGLTVYSDIELPELASHSHGRPDVRIRLGTLDGITVDWKRCTQYYLAPGRVILNITGTARYFITDGVDILVDPHPGADRTMIRMFLLGTAMGCLLHQRGLLPLHANALCYNDECIMFLGQSGAGKSTLAAAMQKRGYELLADDISVVKISGLELPIAYPGVPQIRLREDAAEYFDTDIGKLQRIFVGEDKYVLPAIAAYCQRPLRIKRLYLLDYHEEAQPEFVDMHFLERIAAIRNNTYRKGMIAKMGVTLQHLSMSAIMAQSVPVRRFSRPRCSLEHLDRLLDAIEGDLV